ncbi:von Willebrand factor type A domain-containing protein [Fusarium redolens]|uniref:von Willebrand factor type A domain-containing protein n=1 Tax=Fusarium redolens TaxID=48865 RepID=A0A9P9JMQ5_FUSRE|nr:von Willebrand factor type A domain-containing protein [Fusarium redolens]KAH7230458.1 von Willebrand factor type A domain-containing protein [Fusarium redolens]
MSLFGGSRIGRHGITHPCGCYIFIHDTPKYLPQVQIKAHTTILATTSRTNLTQTFVNTSGEAIDELRYVFPLYDGVSVVAFTCTVGSRVIKGVVKERQKAQQVYNQAKASGQTAGLFKQSLEAADTFTTTIGNIPAGEKVQVDITYLGELKHDAQVDGLRFTIPTQIVPRYGDSQSLPSSNVIQKEGMSFTIDAEMPDGSAIKSIQSPSHPLSVEIGTTSTTKSQDPSLQRASATLQQSTTHLEQDFVVQVVATKLGEPSAILETHPTIPNQRAIMTTLVPKFKLPAGKPEIVFICDRSGSMGGQIPGLKTALQIFLKSLPVGVKFNICSFGSRFSFLWDRSQTYSQETLDKAVQHVETFDSDYGGTEMYQPFEATFQKRYKDMNLEVFLLTDGEIWDQDRLFQLINKEVADSKGTARVFSLGIGAGASTSLIEGIARAGNGFAQTVADDEKMDKKVVRMLRGALFPHISDYSLEIKYDKADTSTEDDFELVEKVVDGLKIDTVEVEEKIKEVEAPKKPISLFDASANDDDDTDMTDAPEVENKFDHLPEVSLPRYLQTPGTIPPLFPFNRTTVYVLLSEDTPSQQPKSVILRGTSSHGPLELEIPITTVTEKDSIIHRLAARKEVKELEEGRGWLKHAKDSDGKFLKEKYDGHFSDMIEREAVRLGVKYQVGGKWCSFVAVEDNGSETERGEVQEAKPDKPRLRNVPQMMATRFGLTRSSSSSPMSYLNAGSSNQPPASGGALFGSSSNAAFGSTAGTRNRDFSSAAGSGGLFGSSRSSSTGGGLFGNSNTQAHGPAPSHTGSSGGLFGAAPGGSFGRSGSLFGSAPPPPPSAPARPSVQATSLAPPAASVDEDLLIEYQQEMAEAAAMPLDAGLEAEESGEDMGFALFDDGPPAPAPAAFSAFSAMPASSVPEAPKKNAISDMEPLQALTTLQSFAGSWSWSSDLERVLGVTSDQVSKLALPSSVKGHSEKDDVLATACAVLFFKNKLQEELDTWEMLVEKAEGWLEENIGEDGVSELFSILEKFF